MMRLILSALIVTCAAGAQAAPYPLGTMTCDDIGQFASEAMQWRKDGMTREQAMANLDARTYNDPVEKENLVAVAGMVFGGYGRNWSVESAGNVMRNDCLAGR
jgi:hypothetical protein